MSAHPQQLPLWPTLQQVLGDADEVPVQRERWLFRTCLLLSDVTMLATAIYLSYWMRFVIRITLSPEVSPEPSFYLRVGMGLIPLWLVVFLLYGLYGWNNLLGGTREYSLVFTATSVGMMLVTLASFLVPTFVISRGWLISSWLLALLLVSVGRFLLRRIVYVIWSAGHWLTPAVVVGSNGEAASLTGQLSSDRYSGYKIVGLVTPQTCSPEDEPTHIPGAVPHLGTAEDIVSIVIKHNIRELLVAASSLERNELLELFERIQPLPGVTIRLSTGLYEVLTTGIEVKTAASIPLIQLNRLRLSRAQSVLKTIFEYSVAALTLALVAPVMLVIAVLVKLDSPGPVIHRRRVLGVGGREFDAFKFRTMYVNGAEILDRHPELREKLAEDGKLRDDPRISRLGRFLRRFSLDEFPQLFNVLRGEMSLVGPRMITLPEASRYGRHRVNLMTVKPGITGLWQVSGRSELSYIDRVRLDMHYIRNYSLWLDLQILLVQTPSAVLRGRGAY